jgi:hypothetical protein
MLVVVYIYLIFSPSFIQQITLDDDPSLIRFLSFIVYFHIFYDFL